ncbi:MAG: hypothetical protein RDU20_16160 [Desulfomonilaceae bacterium]|nr:hypothetical protein [Desulfomonilaceae bacterium]
MDDSERHLWMAVAGMGGLVLVLLVLGPLVQAYREWKTRRAFRLRRRSFERTAASRLEPNE